MGQPHDKVAPCGSHRNLGPFARYELSAYAFDRPHPERSTHHFRDGTLQWDVPKLWANAHERQHDTVRAKGHHPAERQAVPHGEHRYLGR